ncbi:MAG: anthranilate phosphoribosyltransferase [Candidatus Hydrogenedentes bacterium]|nr:anthranilate phosphoribosyltransferase [Candidatus Hydrogenedentota bacterium]
MFHHVLDTLVQGNDLSRDEAADAMHDLMSGEVSPALIGAFLAAMRMKGETIDEITGFAQTMRAMATPVRTMRSPLVDTCGTGGDHSGTFNISTTAAFVVAGAGVAVAKHGNRSASSQCGSADVLEALGVNIDATPEQVGRCIDDVGIGFLFARTLHGAMKHVAGTRRELRLRTVFNVLGPLTNPAGACGQVMGVFDAGLVEPLANVLLRLGTRHAFVVAGSDGLDELTLSGPSHVAEAVAGSVRCRELTPEDAGLERAGADALHGGDAATNAEILRAVLDGEPGPRRDIVLLNAAAGILAAGEDSDWKAAVQTAAESIDSGAASAKLAALVKASHDS